MGNCDLTPNIPESLHGTCPLMDLYCVFDQYRDNSTIFKLWAHAPFVGFGFCVLMLDVNKKPVGVLELTFTGFERRVRERCYRCFALSRIGDLTMESKYPIVSLSSLSIPSKEFASSLESN